MTGSQSPFFGPDGNKLTIANKADLHEKLCIIRETEFPKKSGWKSDESERYSLNIYLSALSEHGALHFPMVVEKHESPDFWIKHPDDITCGLEITKATTKGYQRARTKAESEGVAVGLELDTFSNPEIPDNKQFEQAVRTLDQKLTGRGFIGDEPESKWANIVAHAIIAKTEKLNSGAYALADRNELVVYVHTYLPPALVYCDALSKLRKCLIPHIQPDRKAYNVISLVGESPGDLYYDVLGT